MDAVNLDAAENIILKIRGDEYTSDGGGALEDEIKLIQEEIAKSHAEVQKDLDDLAKVCGADEPEPCDDARDHAQPHCTTCGCDLHEGACPEGHPQNDESTSDASEPSDGDAWSGGFAENH